MPRALLWLQPGLGAAGVLGLIAIFVLARGPGSFSPSLASMLGFALVIAVVVVGLERVELWIVRRAQPFVSEPLLAADDAIRTQSVHSLAGAGIAFLLFMCSLVAVHVTVTDPELIDQMIWAPGLIALLVALGVCQHYGDRAWRVKRARRQRTPTTPA